jgi:hypothetical protein
MGLLDSIFGLIFSGIVIGILIIGGVLVCLGICAVCPDSVEDSIMTSEIALPSIVFIPFEVSDYVCAHYSLGETTVVHPGSSCVMVGADGHRITLINYKTAKDVTKQEVIEFIKADKTDQSLYTSTYVCADYAEDVHNNAEAAGIKCAYVCINFEGEPIGHAFNAFNTTDRGIIYVDCTSFDSIVSIDIGERYAAHTLNDGMPAFLDGCYGPVCNIDIYW